RNIEWLQQAGVRVMQPDEGEMACGEFGPGRLPEPEMVWLEIADMLGLDPGQMGFGGAGPREVAAYLEALEPEDEPEPAEEKQGGLVGLLASIIPRSTPRRIEADEVAYRDEDFAGLPIPEEWAEGVPLPEPDLSG